MLGITRQGVHFLIAQGRIRRVQEVAQPREDTGRFGAGGILLDAGDVNREAKNRGA